jgi:hypothetical protein
VSQCCCCSAASSARLYWHAGCYILLSKHPRRAAAACQWMVRPAYLCQASLCCLHRHQQAVQGHNVLQCDQHRG